MVEPKTELQRNAIMDARTKELTTFQRAMDLKWLDSRMEDGRMGRLLGLVRRESDMERDYQERTDHAAFVNERVAKEAALGYEIAKVRREEVSQLQRRHYMRERDPQLRELMRKLEAGYTCRDLQRQILDNQYKKLQAKAEDNQNSQMLLKAIDEQGQRKKEALTKMEREAEYRQELQQQLVNRQRVKQCQYEETLIEKKMLDDIMRTISDEDKREIEKKRASTEKMAQELKTFKQAQLAWKEKQKVMVMQEQRQIEEQLKLVSDRNSAIIAARKRVLQAREDANKIICAKIKEEQDERLKREDIIRSLQQQEFLEKNIQDDIQEQSKAVMTKRETKAALTAQMNTRKQIEADQKAFDLELRKKTEDKVAEEDRKEKEKNRRLREKNRRYAAELLQQAEANRAQRQGARRDEEAMAKAVTAYHESWDQEVAKERREIIQEHAPHTLGYLKAGVLKKTDLPDVRIGASRHEELAGMDIEGMGNSKRPVLHSKCNAQCRILREY